VTRLDQFKLETRRTFRMMETRIAELESGHTSKRKRPKAPKPSSAEIVGRQGLWGRYLLVFRYFHPRLREATAIQFCSHFLTGLHPSEFSKWLAGAIVPGGCVDLRIRRALEAEIGKLEARAAKDTGRLAVSHENLTNSQQNSQHRH
jgi:hypothetical protein